MGNLTDTHASKGVTPLQQRGQARRSKMVVMHIARQHSMIVSASPCCTTTTVLRTAQRCATSMVLHCPITHTYASPAPGVQQGLQICHLPKARVALVIWVHKVLNLGLAAQDREAREQNNKTCGVTRNVSTVKGTCTCIRIPQKCMNA